jgi:hypothetical protein
MSGRTAYDMGIKNGRYSVVIGNDGADLLDKHITLSPSDPRVARLKQQTGQGYQGRSSEMISPKATLTPGFTYSVDTSKMSGRSAAEMGLQGLFVTVPDASGSPKSEPMPFKAEKNTGVVKAPGVLQMNWNQKRKYV